MPRVAALLLAGLFLGTATCRPATAMQFKPDTSDPKIALISGRGEIIQGDLGRLRAALAAVTSAKNVALLFDSPGGLVAEAEQMGHVIRDNDIAVVIPGNAKCVSACFLLLASALRRFAAGDALVGVHSASESGEETVTSMAVTTAMARVAADFDVPPRIIGKMVSTVPGRVEWLTRDDLIAMGVKILDDSDSHTPAQPPPRQQEHQAAAPPAPAPRPAAAPRPAPAAAPQVAAPAPAPLPPLRRPPAAPASRAPARTAMVAEFQGAYFCGGPTTLTLKVMDAAEGEPRRAVFAFGPTATNPRVAPGAFVIEGRLDLTGGVLDMQPVRGSSQPSGAAMVGLFGHSDDGGRTFAGHVTASLGCTLFTLRRVR